MKSIRKMWLLAVAVAAFAAPATAQAVPTNWSHNGTELTEAGSMGLSGPISLVAKNGLGSVNCQFDGTMGLQAKSNKGSFTSVALTNCEFAGFLRDVCGKPVETTLYNMPWPVEAQKEASSRWMSIGVGVGFTAVEKGAFCPPPWTTTSDKGITASPNSPSLMTSITFGGEASTSMGPAWLKGTLSVKPGGLYYGIL